jgi:hypothetical protein
VYAPLPERRPASPAGRGGGRRGEAVNLHLYHYAGNNPVKYTDPDGNDFIKSGNQFNTIEQLTPNIGADAGSGGIGGGGSFGGGSSILFGGIIASIARFFGLGEGNNNASMPNSADIPDAISGADPGTATGGSGKIPPPPNSGNVANSPDDPDSKRILQNGGRTIRDSTAKALNKKFDVDLNAREWGRKLEDLKAFERNPNNSHGPIMGNGDYYTPNGDYVGNIGEWL